MKFFEQRGHKIIPSSSLIPKGESTTKILTTAGMVQITPYFLGLETPPSRRLASYQKCFRHTDIELVGDSKHLTFFEMLGNFSVGDYFKKEAITWAWEFVTEHLKLPKDRLWVTIYLDDEEAFAYWQQVGVPADRILRFGDEDNFWGPAGDSGPCGPCSEIHYDLGKELGCGKPECQPNCDCGRFSEIWNLVFTQYNQDHEGHRTLLPRPNIDTGMGLERTLAAIEGKPSPYETDLFSPLINKVCHMVGKDYGRDKNTDRSIRIVAEHGRGIAFLIADGVMPFKEGRGYVLRRELRRASYFGSRLGLDKPFLSEIAKVVIAQMGSIYPELIANRALIIKVIKEEEEKFQRTLPVGRGILEGTFIGLREDLVNYFPKFRESFGEVLSQKDIINLTYGLDAAIDHFLRDCKAWDSVLQIGRRDAVAESLKPVEERLEGLKDIVSRYDPSSAPHAFDNLKQSLWEGFERLEADVESVAKELTGFEVFILYDTYGFPPELTAEIAAKERGLSMDWEGFEAEMEKQKKRGRAIQMRKAVTLEPGESKEVHFKWTPKEPGIYDVVVDGLGGKIEVRPPRFVGYETTISQSKVLEIGEKGKSVKTASQGDEVDIILDKTPFYGEMGGQVGDSGEISSAKGKVAITNTIRTPSDVVIHQGKVTQGSISGGDEVEAKVNLARRLDIARNHTATHLLHAALRQVLGGHVQQRGSVVEPERLRFDFAQLVPLLREEVDEVQKLVNERIRQNLLVKTKEVPYSQAIDEGAIALFEEKYGEIVRVVQIGEPAASKELCGGTHIKSTGEIGVFLITSESSIGTGLRRIEAVTGRAAESLIERRLSTLQNVAEEIGSLPEEAYSKTKGLISELAIERKRSLSLERELSRKIAEPLLQQAEQVNGVTVLVAKVPSLTMPILREMGDILRDSLKSAIVVLATVYDSKPNFLAMVTPDLVAKGFHAGDIVKQVAKITGGGGGGKPGMAQAGGKDATRIDEALKSTKGVIASKVKQSHQI